ncbi:MAG TPA: major tail protein [Anaerovoracaceae bacterium]|nr:major tail protein [Anaerovoracaceae bacterium]
MTVKNSAAISVENLVYALLTDEALGTYGTVTPISPVINVKVTPSSSSDVLYAEGRAVETVTSVGVVSVEFEAQDFPLEVQAAMLGHTLDPLTGVMIHNSGDIAPYLALGFKVKKANGKYRHIWLTKGNFEEPGVEAVTQGDKVTFSTPKIKGSFIVPASGDWKYTMDEDSGSAPAVAFLATVYKAV